MDDQESSSGLMIGIIIGAAVVIVIVLLGVFGFGFVWLQRDEAGAAAMRPAPVLVAEHAVEARMPDWKAAPAEPQGLDPNERKLVGTWEAQTLDGSQATIDFRADHTFFLTAKFPDKAAPTQSNGR